MSATNAPTQERRASRAAELAAQGHVMEGDFADVDGRCKACNLTAHQIANTGDARCRGAFNMPCEPKPITPLREERAPRAYVVEPGESIIERLNWRCDQLISSNEALAQEHAITLQELRQAREIIHAQERELARLRQAPTLPSTPHPFWSDTTAGRSGRVADLGDLGR